MNVRLKDPIVGPLRTPGFRDWLAKNEAIQAFRHMRTGSDLHRELIGRGVDSSLLDEFLASDRSRKIPESHPDARACGRKLGELLEGGGLVCGGAALRRRLGTAPSGDVDVFFRGFAAWVRATLETRAFPAIDVCWYEREPWEAFDLAASCLAFGRDGESSSPECERALSTGTCDIRLDRIFHPVATLGRVAKYGDRWGFKFPAGKLAQIVALHGVTGSVVDRAFAHAV